MDKKRDDSDFEGICVDMDQVHKYTDVVLTAAVADWPLAPEDMERRSIEFAEFMATMFPDHVAFYGAEKMLEVWKLSYRNSAEYAVKAETEAMLEASEPKELKGIERYTKLDYVFDHVYDAADHWPLTEAEFERRLYAFLEIDFKTNFSHIDQHKDKHEFNRIVKERSEFFIGSVNSIGTTRALKEGRSAGVMTEQ